nr:DinB family protein [uncultured Pedobacter sp.]
MKQFFKELFEYNFHFNQKILQVLIDHHEQVSDKLTNLSCHLVNVHAIWNNKVLPEDLKTKPWDIFEIKKLKETDIKNFETSMYIIDNFDFDGEIRYNTSNGKEFSNSICDILFQIINHSTYHRAQIATELRQCNIEPLLTDWIFFKMNK